VRWYVDRWLRTEVDPGIRFSRTLPCTWGLSLHPCAAYFLTSCGDDPAVLIQAIRWHWSIENALHWVLDVTFREDDSRVRDRTAARNLALLRKIALNLVARDRRGRASRRGRRKIVTWNDDYMLQIITGQAHA